MFVAFCYEASKMGLSPKVCTQVTYFLWGSPVWKLLLHCKGTAIDKWHVIWWQELNMIWMANLHHLTVNFHHKFAAIDFQKPLNYGIIHNTLLLDLRLQTFSWCTLVGDPDPAPRSVTLRQKEKNLWTLIANWEKKKETEIIIITIEPLIHFLTTLQGFNKFWYISHN